MLATIAVKLDGLAKVRRLAGLITDVSLSDRIGMDPGNVSRILTGKSAPGPKFIAGCMDAFGTEWFADLFEIVPDGETTA